MDIQFLITLGAGLLSAASILLHIIAPRTTTTLDDHVLEAIDKALDRRGV